MQRLAFVIAATMLSACATSSPRDRYVEALNLGLDGQHQRAREHMLALAHEAPSSRAGRRALATLLSEDFALLIAAGTVLSGLRIAPWAPTAAVNDAPVAEALSLLATALERYRKDHGRYCRTWTECGISKTLDSPYLFLLSDREALTGARVADPALLRLQAQAALAELHLTPFVKDNRFVMVAVANLDPDPSLDVWLVDERGTVVQVVSDRRP